MADTAEGANYPSVAVIGAGAIGLLFAALLARAAESAGASPVTLVTRRAATRELLKGGVTVVWPDGAVATTQHLVVKLPDECRAGPLHDVVIVAVSAYDTAQAADLAALLLKPDGMCLTLQNGLDNREVLARVLGDARAAHGATSFAVHLGAPNVVHIDSSGAVWLPRGSECFERLFGYCAAAALNPVMVDDADELVWNKSAIAINGYVALILARPMGVIVHSPAVRDIVRQGCLEVVSVAAAHEVRLDGAALIAVIEKHWANCKPSTLSSLYSDYSQGKKTELEERLGGVVRRARERGVATPALDAMYLLANARLQVDKDVVHRTDVAA